MTDCCLPKPACVLLDLHRQLACDSKGLLLEHMSRETTPKHVLLVCSVHTDIIFACMAKWVLSSQGTNAWCIFTNTVSIFARLLRCVLCFVCLQV